MPSNGETSTLTGQGFGVSGKPAPEVMAADPEARAILRDPDFQTLVRERTAFGWLLSLLMLAVYLTFIFLVAFAPGLMATKLPGGVISLGILIGLCVILFAVLLTGLYVWRANTRFDGLNAAVRKTGGR